jgi:predicted metal-dependent hydrolase
MESRRSQIVLDGIVIDVVRKSIKNLYLTVDLEEGRTRISSPLRISDSEIYAFAATKLAWIRARLEKITEGIPGHGCDMYPASITRCSGAGIS